MSQNLRQIKLRIKSIESTQKITRAMEMVSAAKLNRAKNALYGMRPYVERLDAMLKDLLADAGDVRHSFLEKREPVRNIALCVISSDTGLCGGFNHTVIEAAEEFLAAHAGRVARLFTVGREAFNHFKGRGIFTHSYAGLYGRYSAKAADDITGDLIAARSSGEADEIYIVHTHFDPSLRHRAVLDKVLPVDRPLPRRAYYLFEPRPQAVLDALMPAYIRARMRFMLLDSFTAEHSARMFAMKTATDNADDLIDKLTLQKNKARQFAITKEVLEIASAAEALKG